MPSRSAISNGVATGLDLMNSPIEHPKAQDEPDTCRICRGEGTEDEPLFYPCKCSGSIKFVHQECLMEWLSHSQKKHCELCKTSFRFTKLYHPNMPQQLPLSIFLRRAALHTASTFLVWCRAIIVASVWLFWLPWITRFLWWCMFWVADGGWSLHADLPNHRFNATASIPHSPSSNASAAVGTFLARFRSLPLATLGEMLMPPIPLWRTVANGLASMSFSDITSSGDVLETINNATSLGNTLRPKHDTLLSRLPFFYNLTSHKWLNKFITDILEGQIITFAVVVAAILIFLIREWVVQQQPVINLAAAQGALIEEVQAAHQAQQAQQGQAEDQEEDAPNNVDRESVAQANGGEGSQAGVRSGLMSDEHVDQLIVEIEKSHDDLVLFSERDEWGDTADGDTLARLNKAANLVQRVQDTCLEFQQASKDALQRSDVIELQVLARGLARFQPALRHIPDSWSTSISECVAALEECVETLTGIVGEAEAELPDEPQNANGGAVASQGRPSMPEREESSLATEIRRQLEESSNGNVEPATFSSRQPQRSASPHNTQRSTSPIVELATWRSSELERDDRDEGEAGPSYVPGIPDSWEDTSSSIYPSDESDSERNLPGEAANDLPRPVRIDANASNNATLEAREQSNENLVDEHPRGLFDRMLDWMWADVDRPLPDPEHEDHVEEHVLEEVADEVALDEAAQDEHEDQPGENGQDPEVAAAAAQAGINVNDPEAAEDVEDLEGILELIGMQGPILGLIQNAIFSCVLVAATVGCAVWVPYLWGKVVLMFLAHPVHFSVKVPVALINGFSNFVFDFGLFFVGHGAYWSGCLLAFILRPATRHLPSFLNFSAGSIFTDRLFDMAEAASGRMTDALLINTDSPGPAYLYLSISSHAALHQLRHTLHSMISHTFSTIAGTANFLTENSIGVITNTTLELFSNGFTSTLPQVLLSATHAMSLAPKLLRSTLNDIASTKLEYYVPSEVDLGRWSASDRLVAVLSGYVFFTISGILYLRRGTPITSSKYERTMMDILQQSGGVFKVIFIISIEMLLFPLYCGMLLDVAMLPLFEDTSIQSRLTFTLGSPWTSVFVHWFVGTCYMFHFALFVSMCRKMMRKGVLYFIRDPDDPTFHPVRDVLERTVQSQLRKIAFSGLVYGALVIVCMGSVVWALCYVLDGLLPIRWTPRSALGFPVDLLLYTSLIPLIAFLFRPSIGLQYVYEWWLKRSASVLRLSQFLFGSEEKSEHSSTWTGNGEFQGRFVRAPGSDQVRIPRGQNVFLEVDSANKRLDGRADSDEGLHGLKTFTMVYIPPSFRLRLGIFCACLWILSATTGLIATILPLLVGRSVFAIVTPKAGVVNDLYAYAVGILISASLAYIISSFNPLTKSMIQKLKDSSSSLLQPGLYAQIAQATLRICIRATRFVYTYGTALVVLPTLFALILQLYVLLPLSTYLALNREPVQKEDTDVAQSLHYFQIIQTWSLGLMYVRIMVRLILLRPNSRPYLALRKITEQGWLNPNALVATRAFFLPISVLSFLAICLPIPVGYVGGRLLSPSSSDCEDELCVLAMRFAYPAVLLGGLAGWALYGLVSATRRWRLRIRDEVYLIGERLHNYGEKRPPAHAKRFGDGGVEVDESGVAAAAG